MDEPAEQKLQPEPAPETERQKRDKLRLLLTERLIGAVADPKARASTLLAAIRFLSETNSLDGFQPAPAVAPQMPPTITVAGRTILPKDLPFPAPPPDQLGRLDDD